jgi:hypothetical protein
MKILCFIIVSLLIAAAAYYFFLDEKVTKTDSRELMNTYKNQTTSE